MIRVFAYGQFKDGAKAQAMGLVEELVSETRKEKGCVEYVFVERVDDPNKAAFMEAWESDEALDVHSKSAHFTRLVPQLGELFEDGLTVEKYAQLV